MDKLKAKEKFAENLMRPDLTQVHTTTVLYMVYKTIEANDNITLNQLSWTLGVEFMLKEEMVAGAVASLTSKSLFDCVCRWQAGSKKKDDESHRRPTVHLRVRDGSPDFKAWLGAALQTNPELAVFSPPAFTKQGWQKEARLAKEAHN